MMRNYCGAAVVVAAIALGGVKAVNLGTQSKQWWSSGTSCVDLNGDGTCDNDLLVKCTDANSNGVCDEQEPAPQTLSLIHI